MLAKISGRYLGVGVRPLSLSQQALIDRACGVRMWMWTAVDIDGLPTITLISRCDRSTVFFVAALSQSTVSA